jgi:protein O-GlcNAc transferase
MPSRQELLSAYLETGLHAHAQGDVAAAAVAYRQALRVAPHSADALNLMGVALLQLGQPEQAVDFLQRAVGTLRDNADVLGNLAQAHFALGHYETAREAFRKASRLDSRKMQFPLGVANSLAMQGKWVEAEVLLRKQASRFPSEALVWFNLANAVRDQGRYKEAVELYRRAAELDPNLVDARNNLGSALHALKRFDEAEREYRACIAMAPDYALAYSNLASVVIDLGRFGEAEQLCREMIKRTPTAAQTHTLLGAALGHQGRLLEAVECHRIAAELAPQDAKAAEVYA